MTLTAFDEEEYEKKLARVAKEREFQWEKIRNVQTERGIKPPYESWDFYSGRVLTKAAAKVFIECLTLRLIDDNELRDGVARSLGADTAFEYVDMLIHLYVIEPPSPLEPSLTGVKGGLAAAVSAHALRHKGVFDKVLTLASDASNGLSRHTFFFHVLRKSKDPRSHALIRENAVSSTSGLLGAYLRGKQWRIYWKKHDPILFAQFYSQPIS